MEFAMREKFARFMYGRNGADHLSRLISYLVLIFILLDVFISGSLFYGIAFVLLIYNFFRIFSRNLNKRRAENARYLQLRNKFLYAFRNWKERQKQKKDYAFFRCPSCKAMLRVPRGKGKIRVTCRKCGNAFERRT